MQKSHVSKHHLVQSANHDEREQPSDIYVERVYQVVSILFYLLDLPLHEIIGNLVYMLLHYVNKSKSEYYAEEDCSTTPNVTFLY